MKNIYPGARVRIVANLGPSRHNWTIGLEATVSRIYPQHQCPHLPPGPAAYMFDDRFKDQLFHIDELEPILPPNESSEEMAALEEEACL